MSREELANLPGRPGEQDWLRERMEVLTVREGIALDAALQRGAPADARDAVNLLANLDKYEVVGGIQSYEDLGLYDLEENDTSAWRCGTTSTWTSWAGVTGNSTPDCVLGAAM